MKTIIRNILGFEFVFNVMKITLSMVFSKGLAFLVLPLLTRIYDPSAFATMGLFLTISGFLSLVYTVKLESAMVLPKDDSEASAIFSCLMFIVAIALLASSILLVACYDYAISWVSSKGVDSSYIYLMPVMAAAIALWNIGSSLATREKRFGTIAKATFMQQVLDSVASVGIGLLSIGVNGLVIGKMVGQAASGLRLIVGKIKSFNVNSIYNIKSIIKKYHQFPIFNLPYNLLLIFSRDIIILVFISFGMVKEAGYYAFAKTFIYAPNTFIMNTLAQVFYSEAAKNINNSRFVDLLKYLSKVCMYFGLPPLVFFGFYSEEVISFIFGENWAIAGTYLRIYLPVMYLTLFTGWTAKLYEVTNTQQYMLFIQIVTDIVITFAVLSLCIYGYSSLFIIKVHAMCLFGSYAMYLALALYFSKFHEKLQLIVAHTLAILFILLVPSTLVSQFSSSPNTIFFVQAISFASVMTRGVYLIGRQKPIKLSSTL